MMRFCTKLTMYSAIITSMALAGCSHDIDPTVENFQSAINQFRGYPVDTLVTQWGPPDSSFEMKNTDVVYQWKHQYTDVMRYPVTRPMVGWGWWGWYPAYSGYGYSMATAVYDRKCATRVTTDKMRIIKDIYFKGDGCVAYPLKQGQAPDTAE